MPKRTTPLPQTHRSVPQRRPRVKLGLVVRVATLLVVALGCCCCCSFRVVAGESTSYSTTASRPGIRGTAGKLVETETKTRTNYHNQNHIDPTSSNSGNGTPIVDLEERLLWRNETPRDDDDELDTRDTPMEIQSDNDDSNNARPGIAIAATMSMSRQKQHPSGSNFNFNFDNEEDEEIVVLVSGEDDDDWRGPSNSTNTTQAESMLSDEADESENDEDRWFELAVSEGPNHNNYGYGDDDREDCSWSVTTGTGCTSPIFAAVRHETLVADGRCRYSDVLGFYRAGCSRSNDDNETDEEESSTSTAAAASIVLEDVFCTDDGCSRGCMSLSSSSSQQQQQSATILPGIAYPSRSCYDPSSDGNGDTAANHHYHTAMEQGVGDTIGLDVEMLRNADNNNNNQESWFSFEFVGDCPASSERNCHVIAAQL
eukprot:jgi/Psemu1/285712/fgenesh1_pg.100_\